MGLLPKKAYQGWVTGTFVNRNTAASFFGLGMIVALSLATASAGAGLHDRPRLMITAAVILLIAVAMTGSRARLERQSDGNFIATPFDVQDSSMQRTLAAAGCLIVRPPHAPAAGRRRRG